MGIAWVLAGQGGVGTDLPTSVVFVLAAVAAGVLIGAGVVFGRLKSVAATKKTPMERLAAYRTATIIAFAPRESAAVIGLCITLLGGDIRWCLGLGAVSVISMLLDWPKASELKRLAADPTTAPIG